MDRPHCWHSVAVYFGECSNVMKNLAVVVLCLAIAQVLCFTEEQKEIIKKNKRECAEKTAVNRLLLLQIQNGDWNVEDKNVKKWFRCMMEKSGLLSLDGVFNNDVALSKVPEEDKPEVQQLISRCLNTSLKRTEMAWQFSKCYLTSHPKHSIF